MDTNNYYGKEAGIPEDYRGVRGTDRAWAEISLDALISNLESLKSRIPENTGIINVIKSDGYGHGAVPIAVETEKLPFLWGHAVAAFEEAAQLRSAGIKKPILILGYTFPYCYEALIREAIRPAVFREDMLNELSDTAVRTGIPCHIHIAVDTGMNRIGVRPDDSGLDFVRRAFSLPGIDVEGLFTHFAKADEEDPAPTVRQLELFTAFEERIRKETGRKIPLVHCANSAAILAHPDACRLNLVRSGIIGYGLLPDDRMSPAASGILPVMSLYTKIVFIKDIPAGSAVSYGGTFTAPGTMRIATLPIGYADGYPRGLSSKGFCLIHGKKAPILGRVCMDQMMVDVTDIPEASEGDTVVLIGKDGGQEIRMETLSALCGRFNYEFACLIGNRIPRVYIMSGKKAGTVYGIRNDI